MNTDPNIGIALELVNCLLDRLPYKYQNAIFVKDLFKDGCHLMLPLFASILKKHFNLYIPTRIQVMHFQVTFVISRVFCLL